MRRAIIYYCSDRAGRVGGYVPAALTALREHAERLVIVSAAEPEAAARASLERLADTVLADPSSGRFAAYAAGLRELGWSQLADWDEVLLTDDSWFGPITPFAATFERMAAEPELDVWGLTRRAAPPELPLDLLAPAVPARAPAVHAVQSYWLALRTRALGAPVVREFLDQPPDGDSDVTEQRFADLLRRHGLRSDVAFQVDELPVADCPVDDPTVDAAAALLAAGCPVQSLALLRHEPDRLDREAVLGAEVLAGARAAGYPVDPVLRHLARTTRPRTLYTNAALLSVLPEQASASADTPPPRICVLLHLFYLDMLEELMAGIGTIPVPYHLVVTTDTDAKQAAVRDLLAGHAAGSVEVRVVASNAGRSESAFLLTCADVLTDGRYDLILKVHSKRSPQDGPNRSGVFRRHTLDSLLSSPGYVANVLALFGRDETLGMVVPPLIHIGFPTLGHAWFTNREPAERLAARLGIAVPFDDDTPYGALGGMFWARPAALAKLTGRFTADDFADGADAYRDGALTHVLERLYAYAVLDAGYTVRTVTNARWAAIDYTLLEYKLQRLSAPLPAFTEYQLAYLQRLQRARSSLLAFGKDVLATRAPRLSRALQPAYRAAANGYRAARGRLPVSRS
jgi:rhamnosyltransferase